MLRIEVFSRPRCAMVRHTASASSALRSSQSTTLRLLHRAPPVPDPGQSYSTGRVVPACVRSAAASAAAACSAASAYCDW